MDKQLNRYIDPLTDFGFKHLFGSEPDKEIMIEFLNALFEGEKHIVDLIYSPTEHAGVDGEEKKVFFDLTCTGKDGEKFIIEMQRTPQTYFKDRCIFYMSRLISGQITKGIKDYSQLKGVFLIGILEFPFNDNNSHHMRNISLMDRNNGEVFYRDMGYKFLVLPNFDKKEHELESDLDRWFFLLKNLSTLEKIPDYLDKRIFQKLFKIAEVSKLTKEQREIYESNLKAKEDYYNSISYAAELAAKAAAEAATEAATEKARKERENRDKEIVANAKKLGMSNESIVQLTGLPLEEIEKI
jgi:predicted transposase/invertase (TIGR01784 family)